MTLREVELAGGMTLTRWCACVGISARTARNYRRAGKLKTVRRFGRLFVTAQTIRDWFSEEAVTKCRQ